MGRLNLNEYKVKFSKSLSEEIKNIKASNQENIEGYHEAQYHYVMTDDGDNAYIQTDYGKRTSNVQYHHRWGKQRLGLGESEGT